MKGRSSSSRSSSILEATAGTACQALKAGQVAAAAGDWYHAGYHLATTIATPAAYAPLPWAFAMLTWPGGIVAFVIGVVVTWYNSLLLASLHEYGGVRHTRYKDLAGAILGEKAALPGFMGLSSPEGKWGVYSTVFFQQVASLGNNITIQIVAGQAIKAIYKAYAPNGSLTLQHCIIIFGALQLLLSQLPNIHALRGLNLLSTMATLAFATAMDRSAVSYGLGDDQHLVLMSAFAALGTIAFRSGIGATGNGAGTVKAPSQRNMYKGVSLAYGIITVTYLAVAITGYWAFGYAVNPFVVYSFPGPQWAVTLALLLAVVQIVGCYQIYTRPTYEFVEVMLARHDEGPMSPWNAGMRLVITSVYMLVVTTICCMIPFFIDFVALVGALGFTPLDFILPVLLFMAARKTPLWWKLLNCFLAVAYTVVGVLGCVGAFYFIIDHARTYKLFADL
ncbi:lysine histidine transporter-like 5-like protein [Scenedesmus sp. NREL 46B-D3]|nr:lysine histidine transporter-like 5-like protein [Scenedesmus sp. NREL 46B-D3]